MKTIVFIAFQISQPRALKRIESIYKSGFDIKVYGIDNGIYSHNLDNLSFPIYRLLTLPKTANRKTKIIFLFKTIRNILKENNENSVFYIFAYEKAAIVYLLGCRKYIYEEADVLAARIKNGLIRNAMLALDRMIIRSSKLTVFTSGGFVGYIFGKRRIPQNYILLPNKLSPYFKGNKRTEVVNTSIDYNAIKFGFVGLIRYPNTIIRFAKVIGKYFPQHQFHFFGDVERKEYLDNEVRLYSNVFIHGPFLNPTDLNNIYAAMDINVVCYDTDSGNVKIAEPNKLYETIFFETPIVVSRDTFLAEQVKKAEAGDCIDASSDDGIISYVKSLTINHYNTTIEKMRNTNADTLIDNPIELITRLKQICN